MNYAERRARLGEFIGRGQRLAAAATTRAAEHNRLPVMHPEWDHHLSYTLGDVSVPLGGLTDAVVWETVIWCARNVLTIYRDSADGRKSAAKSINAASEEQFATAALWMASRPLFIGLVRQLANRRLSLPEDVFNFVRGTLLNADYSMEGHQPWRDTGLEAEQRETMERLKNVSRAPTPMLRVSRAIDVAD